MNKYILGAFAALFQLPVYAATPSLPSEFRGENIITGHSLSLSTHDESKKGLVVIFMSAECPCSNSHVPLIKKLAGQYKDFRFVAVHSNTEESKSMAQQYFKNMDLPFEVIQDEKTKLADLMKAYKTPHTFVISPKGEVLYQGGMTNSSNGPSADRFYLAEALQDISEGRKVRTPEGRTLGCIIARENEKNVW